MGRPSKRAKKIRKAAEFSLPRLLAALDVYRGEDFGRRKLLKEIMAARDAQLAGIFAQPARLIESMQTDDAIFVARSNRLEPQKCLGVAIRPANDKSKAKTIAAEAEALYGHEGIGVVSGALADINACFVDHGIAIGVNVANERDDGSRIDLLHAYWPIEWVRWDPIRRLLMTRVDPETVTPADLVMPDKDMNPAGAYEIPIVHGDGRWTIYAGHAERPWRKNAALLPAAFVWARHAFALRDWAKGSVAHGFLKIVGELPEGVMLQEAEGGDNSEEAKAMLALMKELAEGESPFGVRPAGSKTEVLATPSNAWQVWKELVDNGDKAAARIYLGTDGVLGAQGGAPGVDIEALFGVALTKVQSDLEILTRGLREGVIEPWTAINFGDSTLAPARVYILPDQDGDAARDSLAKRRQAFYADIAAAKTAGMVIDQAFIDELGEYYDVIPPKLPAAPLPSVVQPEANGAPVLNGKRNGLHA